MMLLDVRSANRGVSDTREKCAHRREGHSTSKTIAHSSASNNQKVPQRKPVFLRITGAQEYNYSSKEGHQQPPQQRSRPLFQRPLLVGDSSHHEREYDFKREKSNSYFGKCVFADSFGLGW